MSRLRLFALASILVLPACSTSSSSTTTAPSDAGTDDVADALAPPLPWSRDGGAHLPEDDTLRVNHMQTMGTHNSYHVESPGNTVPDWHYTLAPLDVQLGAQGLRQLELDVHYLAPDADLEVFHLGIDMGSTCLSFRDCLRTIGQWSGAHPDHAPIYIQIEPKTGFSTDIAEAYFAKLEAEILSVLVRERIVTPDEVRGGGTSLGDTVKTQGWPTLAQTRGRIIFTFDDDGDVRNAYSRNGTSLDGRLIFVDSSPGDPIAAVAILNDPIRSADAIKAALAANMIVRTMAEEPQDDDATSQTALINAIASNATWISTNFPVAVSGRTFVGTLPGGATIRCNPATAPTACVPADIDDVKP